MTVDPRYLAALLATLLATLVGACGSSKEPPSAEEQMQAPTRRAELRERRAFSTNSSRIPQLLEEGVPEVPGRLLRVYRRSVTSGVLQIQEERTGEGDAAHRLEDLATEGWRPWPPLPAPELAAAIAQAHPDLAGCNYLFAVSDLPDDLLTEPGRTVTCFVDLRQLEAAHERESVIRHHQGAALPCLELRSITVKEIAQARIRDLRLRCRKMGIVVEPRSTSSERSAEVRRRSRINRAPLVRVLR